MPTKINLSDYYQKYPKKIVDRIFKKFIELNSEESNMYNERFDKILELKNKNPYLSGREYHRLLYGDKFEEIWNNKNKNIITPYKQEYWLNKGYSRKESIEMISNYKKNKSTSLDNFILKYGEIEGNKMVIACMDFAFIGGSLGSVMGEKFSRAVDYCIAHRLPYMVISKSGGARMMESAFSLMQLAKTSGKLSQLSDASLPYLSLLTDPTFGGISASFGMLGDLNIAEPGALIGFAGPRVIKETIKRDLPEGFQRSEFLLEHGFLDFIVERKNLKAKLAQLIRLFQQ